MSQALQIRRGLKSALPTVAALGEPLVTTDTHELYVGTGSSISKISDVMFASSAPPVITEKLWLNTATDTLYRASDDGLSWVTISGGSGSGALTADLTVYGVTQGMYSSGQTIPAGTSLEDIVKNMLQTIIPPVYTSPSLNLAGSGQFNLEAGTNIQPILTPTFNMNDGGSAILYTLRKDGVEQVSSASVQAFSDIAYTLGDFLITYQATVSFNQGGIKNDNMGNPYPTGQIQAGSVNSNPVQYNGKRMLFFAADTGVAAPTSSAEVRILAGKQLGPINGTTLSISIPAGTKRVVIAYPSSIRDITSIKYVEFGNGEVKDTFSLATINVEGANGFTPIGYKVYSYVPAEPFGDAVTYAVTL